MKYVVLIGDGMADYPLPELNDKTPLDVAETLNMDSIAQRGICGTVKTIPETMPPGSDVANLSIMGYDPTIYYTGRGPLEAGSMGIKVSNEDVVYRCNLVTVIDGIMVDYSSDHISTEEARELINSIQNELGSSEFRFYPGVSYRHIMVQKNGSEGLRCTPPHDITGKEIGPYMPTGEGQEVIRSLMDRSVKILNEHPVNLKRMKLGKKPANMIWLWGQGKAPTMPKFVEKYGLKGSVISAVDLIKGIGFYAGLNIINVPGATGYLDTNYVGKAEYALESLRENDFVLVHVEAPDEAAHAGDIPSKIQAIEDFDKKVVGTILKGIEQISSKYMILVLPDHLTPISVRTHVHGPVPFTAYWTSITPDEIDRFCESSGALGSLHFKDGYELLPYLIKVSTEQSL